MPDVSIIILTKNAGNRFEELMNAIYNQNFDGNFEIVVVDSGSTDNTLEIAEKYNARIFKIKPNEFHHSRTRNFGAEKSYGKVLVYLTQDALPLDNNWLSNLLTPLNDRDVAVVYGRQIAYPNAKPMDKFFYSYFYPNCRKVLTKDDTKDLKKFYLDNVFISNVCSAIRRRVWEKIRFNDKVFMSEDKDFALRVLRAGYKIIYEPKAAVYHSHNYTLVSLFKRRFKDGVAYSYIASHGKDEFISKGLRYFVEEIKFLVNNGYIKWIPYALIYDFVYFLAFQLGKRFGGINNDINCMRI